MPKTLTIRREYITDMLDPNLLRNYEWEVEERVKEIAQDLMNDPNLDAVILFRQENYEWMFERLSELRDEAMGWD